MPYLPISPKPSYQSFQGISYEQVKPGKPPLPIVSAPRPSSARANLHPSLRDCAGSVEASEGKRDSGYATSINYNSSADTDYNGCGAQSVRSSQSLQKSQSLRKSQSLPKFTAKSIRHSPSLKKLRFRSEPPKVPMSQTPDEAPTLPELSLPKKDSSSLGLDDMTAPGGMEFSKRGSLYIRGERPVILVAAQDTKPITSPPRTPTRLPPRVLSFDEEALSKRVRSMYEIGGGDQRRDEPERFSLVVTEPAGEIAEDSSSPTVVRKDSARSLHRTSFLREDQELAGGIEDWQDVNNEDVDRYGFITPKRDPEASNDLLPVPQPGIHRVATSLQLAAQSPRRSRSKIGRNPPALQSTRSLQAPEKSVQLPQRPFSSYHGSPVTRHISIVRMATNKLPQNRDRRYMDEAGDMLTLSPKAAAEDKKKRPSASKKKESSREEKWRKMAKISQPEGVGGSTQYEFDPKDPKVISRTWKGIPDRWRATAWHNFLSASAKRYPHNQSDAELIAAFHELTSEGSPDDIQIDLDVPRTISSHIMFRRRYRGGQRLLFRVLHALSLYFPDTGYVQGMAPLAATFLCYFEEEMAFVMLVRLWETRGLDRLYQNGFAGLMDALNEFEKDWVAGSSVSAKLTELGIAPTTFGTRWYLTIFNYAIPFPAQLRVWDIFLLLGDPDTIPVSPPPADDSSFHGGLDVLHATSAALIDGIRDILLESDFENAMKTLTSWIPIRDEDVLMKVTRAEWKAHHRKK